MKKFIFSSLFLLLMNFVHPEPKNVSKIDLLKEMFQKMVVNKDASLIPYYYAKDLILYSNGNKENYAEFYDSHKKYYQTPIQYQIKFDDNATIENNNKVAARIFITTKLPNQPPQLIEVLLIAEYKDNKISKAWEVTDPDWSKMKAFKK